MAEDQLVKSGVWQGEYLDVNGHRGKLRLDLEAEGGRVTGRYRLTLAAEDEPETISGRVEGSVEGSSIRFEAPVGKQEAERILYEGSLRPAGSFALQAIYGTVEAVPQENFGGGVWIVWRFKSSD